jgi:hypothetical protein
MPLTRRRAAVLGAALLGATQAASSATPTAALPVSLTAPAPPPAPLAPQAAGDPFLDGPEPQWARPGPYRNPDAAALATLRRESFGPEQRIALTCFFY